MTVTVSISIGRLVLLYVPKNMTLLSIFFFSKMTVQEHYKSGPGILIDAHGKEILRTEMPNIKTHAL